MNTYPAHEPIGAVQDIRDLRPGDWFCYSHNDPRPHMHQLFRVLAGPNDGTMFVLLRIHDDGTAYVHTGLGEPPDSWNHLQHAVLT